MNSLLDAALDYARRGLPVFPLWPVLEFKPGHFTCGCGKTIRCDSPGKHPISHLARHGLKDATTDERVIREWWTIQPDANIAIATGGGIVVVDIDPRHGGDVALVELQKKHGRLPQSWRVSTGGGGMHIYFAPPINTVIKNSAGLVGPGIDVRGDGGYAVGPPSRHVSGEVYRWRSNDGDLAVMPEWLIATLQQSQTKSAIPITQWRDLARNGVAEGKRNDAVARLSGHLLRRDVDAIVTLELVQAWNAGRCTPPLAMSEVTAIVSSIVQLEKKRRLG